MTTLVVVNKIDTHLLDPNLEIARHFITELSEAIASERAYAAAIVPLKVELENAVADYETTYYTKAAFADCFEEDMAKRSDLLWLCNQCKYYLSVSYVANHEQPTNAKPDRGLWQVKQAFRAIALLKLVASIRNCLPGSKVVSSPWRDILPGIRLWFK